MVCREKREIRPIAVPTERCPSTDEGGNTTARGHAASETRAQNRTSRRRVPATGRNGAKNDSDFYCGPSRAVMIMRAREQIATLRGL